MIKNSIFPVTTSITLCSKTKLSRNKDFPLTENLAENAVQTAEFFPNITQEIQKSMAFSIATADV